MTIGLLDYAHYYYQKVLRSQAPIWNFEDKVREEENLVSKKKQSSVAPSLFGALPVSDRSKKASSTLAPKYSELPEPQARQEEKVHHRPDLKQEAAYNLSLIYRSAGCPELARQVLMTYSIV